MSHTRDKPPTYTRWSTNFARAVAIAAAMVVAMLATGDPGLPEIIVAVPPFMFMVYVIFSSRGSRRARRAEEDGAIGAVISLVAQCERLLLRMSSIGDDPGGHRARTALGHLLAAVRLLGSQYRRYLSRGAVLAVQEAERIIIDASLPGAEGGEAGIEGMIRPLSEQIRAVREGVLGVDDPRLRAMRETL